jgi:hypothetical protein
MKPMTQVTPEADMADTDQIEWPREIWMAERGARPRVSSLHRCRHP